LRVEDRSGLSCQRLERERQQRTQGAEKATKRWDRIVMPALII
jgi:hypothetical protein